MSQSFFEEALMLGSGSGDLCSFSQFLFVSLKSEVAHFQHGKYSRAELHVKTSEKLGGF